jgi:hypothetical protein
MKKALAGPAKRTAKKKPERPAMIAATRRLRGALSVDGTRGALRRLAKGLRAVPARAQILSRRADRAANRVLRRAHPPLARAGRRLRAQALRLERRVGRGMRPAGRLLFAGLATLERRLLRVRDLALRAATRAGAVLTPERAICLTVAAAAACLAASQFVDYRAVEIGGQGYAGLPAAQAPRIGAEAAGAAHAYLLLPVAVAAAALALAALLTTPRRRAENRAPAPVLGPSAVRRRQGLGRVVFVLGVLSLAVVLLVDLPAGLDAGAQASRFSAATAVLLDGFYAEIASAAGLMLGGLLLVAAPKAAARYHARPCRIRISSFARAASGLRRRRRRRASSRDRAARRGSRRRSGAASAPASPR